MNISKLSAKIPAAFEYSFVDADGNEQKEQITIELARLSFGKSTSKEFRTAMENVNDDARPIAQILSDLIVDWNLHQGEDDTPKLPITVESIESFPPDFVGQLAEAVFGRLFPNPQKAESSANGSAQAAN